MKAMAADSKKLRLTDLCGMHDLNDVLIDALMYSSDLMMASSLHLLQSETNAPLSLKMAMEKLVLVEDEGVALFGTVHEMRNQVQELGELVRSHTQWGVHSRLSGPFNATKLKHLLGVCNRLIQFMHAPRVDNAAARRSARRNLRRMSRSDSRTGEDPNNDDHDGGGGDVNDLDSDPSVLNYGGDSDDEVEGADHHNASSVKFADVSKKWFHKMGKGHNHYHQNLLSATNLQEVLVEGLGIDSNIAYKGSICTEKEKEESKRRLDMAMKALFTVTKAFMWNNPKNQGLLFKHLDLLIHLARPAKLATKISGVIRTMKKGRRESQTTSKLAHVIVGLPPK